MADIDTPILCQKCGIEIECGRAQFYVVHIVAFADPSPPDLTEEDLRRDVRRLIDSMSDLSEQEAMDQVYRRVTLYLCNGCYRDWIENPVG